MAFKDPVAYLVIKIWIKSKLPKLSYNQRLRLIKLTLKYFGIVPLKTRHDVTKLDLTVPLLSLWCIDIDLSIQTTLLKRIKPVCNPVTACSLCSITSISHISSF